ncbi:hypothetical protein BHM03_00058357 [Ensete ventricosum]|nr:hypothetical protein BHM03_00058357 [Ensete ventricosum]
MAGSMQQQPDDGPRYNLGIGPSLDDAVGSHRKFASRFAEGIGKLAGNAKGNCQKEDQRTCYKIVGGCQKFGAKNQTHLENPGGGLPADLGSSATRIPGYGWFTHRPRATSGFSSGESHGLPPLSPGVFLAIFPIPSVKSKSTPGELPPHRPILGPMPKLYLVYV